MIPYVRHTVDVEHLFTLILRAELQGANVYGYDEITVLGQHDFDAINHLPMVTVRALNGQMLGGPNAWEWDVFITIVGYGRDQMADLADMVYVAMHESHDKNTRIPGVGAVTSVNDQNMPSRTSTSVTPAGDLTQYNGQFAVIVRKI